MLIAMAFPAMAAGKGTITITANSNSADLSKKEFTLHRVLNATVDDKAVSYTVNETYKDVLKETIKAIEGEDYDLSDRDAIYTYIAKFISGDNQVDNSKLRRFADTLKEKLVTSGITGEKYSANTNDNTNDVTIGDTVDEGKYLQISNLDYGYYVVVDSTESNGDGAISLTMLNSVTPNSKIEIKSDYPSVEKKVKGDNGEVDIADFEIGDEIEFTLNSTVPSMDGYSEYTFNFHDTLSSGLTYVADSVTVKIGNTVYYASSEYKEDTKVFTVAEEKVEGSTKLTVKLADLIDLKSKLNISTKDDIVVTYKATLNNDAITGKDGNTNKVYIEYSNDPYNTESKKNTPEDKVIVYTYQLDVSKTNTANVKLANAKFELYRTDDTGKISDKVKFSKVDGEYIVNLDPNLKPEDEAVITSQEDKNIILKGLDAGIYYLKEIEAPDGYNMLKDPVKVTITPTYEADALTALEGSITGEWDGATATADLTSGKISFTVINSSGVKLPETGGFGTTIFYLAGFVIMAGAVTAFFYTRRKDNK